MREPKDRVASFFERIFGNMNILRLYGRLLAQQWKESLRSPMFQKSLLINLIMGFFFLYLLASFLLLGFALKYILEDVFERPAIEVLNGFLLYTLLGGLFLRFLIQRVPLLDITRYLHLPIKKGLLLHFIFLKTFFSVYNLFPLVFILPLFFNAALPEYPLNVSLAWLALLLSLVLLNNLFAFYLKKAFTRTPWFVAAFGVLLLGLFLLNYYQMLDLMFYSHLIFDPVLEMPLLALIPIGSLIAVYLLLHRWTRSFLRLDKGLGKKVERVQGQSDLGLKRLGSTGRMAAFELDMIRRNKRPKTFALVAFLFLLYGLIFYPNPAFEGSYAMMIFVGVLTTGIFMMQFGQLHFSWDSPHFDKLLTSRLRIRDYIRSKYLLMVLSCAIMFVLSLPYAYFGTEIVLINLSSMLFNIGFSSMAFLFLAMYNRKGMNLSNSNMFNYEGMQASQFLIVPVILGIPYLLYAIFYILGHPLWGIGAIGLFGGLCLFLHPLLFSVLERMFHERKHLIAEGFRST